MSSKTIAVLGATGIQGSSVARTFCSLPGWTVRALVRNPASPQAQELASLGAELHKIDLDDKASLQPALDQVHAVFCLTTFWHAFVGELRSGTDLEKASHIGLDTEVRHMQNVATVASAVPTLEKFVISALGPIRDASGGKYVHGFHWEGKAQGLKWIRQNLPALSAKMSAFYPGCYADNQFLLPKKDAGGEYVMALPSTDALVMPIINAAASCGPFVRCLVEDEEPGLNLLGYGSQLTMKEALALWERLSGLKATFRQLSVEEMKKFAGLPDELVEPAAYIGEFGYMSGVQDPKEPKDLKNPPAVPSYEEFLAGQPKEYLLEAAFPRFS